MIRAELDSLAQGNGWSVHGRSVSIIEKGPAGKAIRFDEGTDSGLAIRNSSESFGNGTIECDLRGKNIHQRSFIGIAFHGLDENTFDLVYFRPFNFKSGDRERRVHAVQYCAIPTHGWQKLRTEKPGQYEKAVLPIPNPDDWFHMRLVVEYPKVSVYVNDAREPSLTIDQLSDRKKGWVGLWVGPNSGGDFASLEISRAEYSPALIVG